MSKKNLKNRIQKYYKYLYENSSEYNTKMFARNAKLNKILKRIKDEDLKDEALKTAIAEMTEIKQEKIVVEVIDAPNKDQVIKEVQRLERRLSKVC